MSCANVTSLSSPQGQKAQENLGNLEPYSSCVSTYSLLGEVGVPEAFTGIPQG